MKTKNIVWFSKDTEEMEQKEMFDYVSEKCTPGQTQIIIDHVIGVGPNENMLIGYDKKDVYLMFVEEERNKIVKIEKNKNKS